MYSYVCRFLRRMKLSMYRKSFVSCELRTSAVYSCNEVEKSMIKRDRSGFRGGSIIDRGQFIDTKHRRTRQGRNASNTNSWNNFWSWASERASKQLPSSTGDTCREVSKEDACSCFQRPRALPSDERNESSDAMEIKRRAALTKMKPSNLLRLPRDVIDSIGYGCVIRGIS